MKNLELQVEAQGDACGGRLGAGFLIPDEDGLGCEGEEACRGCVLGEGEGSDEEWGLFGEVDQ